MGLNDEYSKRMIVTTDLCTACRACELACHYHHTGKFGTTEHSVHISYQEDTIAIRAQLLSVFGLLSILQRDRPEVLPGKVQSSR